MKPTVDEVNALLLEKEDEHLECKEAKGSFHFERLLKYVAALANERGGILLLGVSNRIPRRVVGSAAFPDLERTRAGLASRLHLKVDVDAVHHPDGRVVVVRVPERPIGMPVSLEGAYWMRAGEELVPMTPDQLQRIFQEAVLDPSAEVSVEAGIEDLSPGAIDEFRKRWVEKSRNETLLELPRDQLLRDAELVTEKGVTIAALVLLGSREALGRLLPNAEVVFEYRSGETPGPAQQRKEYRAGFFLHYDDLWNQIQLRNDVQHYRDGLFILDVATFDERSVREVVLNAVSHRDYRLPGSVFIRQFPRRLEVQSPGGLPVGITIDNLLDRQAPRNRRIADVFAKCGLVERSGQGMDLMFERSLRQGKPAPDLSGTDSHTVVVTLRGDIRDAAFAQSLERLGREGALNLDTRDLVVLDLIHREESIPVPLQGRVRRLMEVGVVESVGRGRGTRYLLSRRFLSAAGRRATYTRRRGLDRSANKQLLLSHLEGVASGSPLGELQEVLPQLGRRTIQALLAELREEGRVRVEGKKRWARWKVAKNIPKPDGA